PRRGAPRRDAERARGDPCPPAHPDRGGRRGDRSPRSSAAECERPSRRPRGGRGLGARRWPPRPRSGRGLLTRVVDHPGPVAVDSSALQSPTSRGRGIGRYAAGWALAIESLRPDLVACYLLNPDLPPPGELEGLLATDKVRYRDSDRLPAGVRGLH